MKYQIRRNIFETNSSSVHVIAIGKSNWKNNLPPDVYFELGQFGWESETYIDTYSQASYLYTAIADFYLNHNGGCKNCEEVKKCRENGSLKSFNEYHFKKALDFISSTLSEYGVESEFQDINETPDFYYYVDHADSLREFINKILSSKELLMSYLFSNTIIETGNDNSDEFPNFEDYNSSGEYKYVYEKYN